LHNLTEKKEGTEQLKHRLEFKQTLELKKESIFMDNEDQIAIESEI